MDIGADVNLVLTGGDFRQLVKGNPIIFAVKGIDSGSIQTTKVRLVLSDIGFSIMLDAIEVAINEKDKADEDTNSGPALS